MEIPLTRGFVAQIDDDDAELVQQHGPWAAGEFGRPGLWYAFTNVKTEQGWRVLYMHRLLMDAQRGQIVDHVDDDGLRNNRENLQFLTHAQNLAKRRGAERKTVTTAMVPKETTRRRRSWAERHPTEAAMAQHLMTLQPESA